MAEEVEASFDEYNDALDNNVQDDIERDGEQDGSHLVAEALATAVALGITEAPNAKIQILLKHHPEISPDYEDTVKDKLLIGGVYPPTRGTPGHTSAPFLTLYERTKILSLRASQLAHGAEPFITVPKYLITVYDIARAELEEKRLPYILKRPLPNGNYEYWKLSDLMIL